MEREGKRKREVRALQQQQQQQHTFWGIHKCLHTQVLTCWFQTITHNECSRERGEVQAWASSCGYYVRQVVCANKKTPPVRVYRERHHTLGDAEQRHPHCAPSTHVTWSTCSTNLMTCSLQVCVCLHPAQHRHSCNTGGSVCVFVVSTSIVRMYMHAGERQQALPPLWGRIVVAATAARCNCCSPTHADTLSSLLSLTTSSN